MQPIILAFAQGKGVVDINGRQESYEFTHVEVIFRGIHVDTFSRPAMRLTCKSPADLSSILLAIDIARLHRERELAILKGTYNA